MPGAPRQRCREPRLFSCKCPLPLIRLRGVATGWFLKDFRLAFAPQRETIRTTRPSLIKSGYDFGFGSFFPGGLLGALPAGARTIVQTILDNPAVYVPPVISEAPQTWEELEELDPELFEPILETRPGRTPDPYPQPADVILGDPQAGDTVAQHDEEVDMAHDWGHLAREFLGGVGSQLLGQNAASYANESGELLPGSTAAQLATQAAVGGGGHGDGCDGMVWAGGVPPKGYKVVNSCGVGVLRKVRRRRRKRMLTVSDKNDIASIISMVGKGQLAATLMNRGG